MEANATENLKYLTYQPTDIKGEGARDVFIFKKRIHGTPRLDSIAISLFTIRE